MSQRVKGSGFYGGDGKKGGVTSKEGALWHIPVSALVVLAFCGVLGAIVLVLIDKPIVAMIAIPLILALAWYALSKPLSEKFDWFSANGAAIGVLVSALVLVPLQLKSQLSGNDNGGVTTIPVSSDKPVAPKAEPAPGVSPDAAPTPEGKKADGKKKPVYPAEPVTPQVTPAPTVTPAPAPAPAE